MGTKGMKPEYRDPSFVQPLSLQSPKNVFPVFFFVPVRMSLRVEGLLFEAEIAAVANGETVANDVAV